MRIRTMAATVIAVVVLLAACGNDDGDSANDVTSTTEASTTTAETSGDGDDFTNPDEPIDVTVGETFTISLESNPTTGYAWEFAEPLDESILESRGSEYEADQPQAVGSGGTEHFSFEAVGEGSTTIELEYVPPGEESGDVESFDVTVG